MVVVTVCAQIAGCAPGCATATCWAVSGLVRGRKKGVHDHEFGHECDCGVSAECACVTTTMEAQLRINIVTCGRG
eukprot:1157746-Pelagomonas_calceolata.AAC.4